MGEASNPFRRVGWLQAARSREFRERLARAPECLSRLAGAQLAAVPDDRRFDRSLGRRPSHLLDSDTPLCRQRPLRIDVRGDGVTVVNEVELH